MESRRVRSPRRSESIREESCVGTTTLQDCCFLGRRLATVWERRFGSEPSVDRDELEVKYERGVGRHHLPSPFSPYASWGGTTSRRLPPTFIPGIPSSHPLVTRPWPSVKLNGATARATIVNDAVSLPLGGVTNGDLVAARHSLAAARREVDDLKLGGGRRRGFALGESSGRSGGRSRRFLNARGDLPGLGFRERPRLALRRDACRAHDGRDRCAPWGGSRCRPTDRRCLPAWQPPAS